MFTAALFCKLKTTQMSINREMVKWRTILTMEYYADTKRSEPLIYTTAWTYLTDLLRQGNTRVFVVWFPVCDVLEKAKLSIVKTTRNRIISCETEGRWVWGNLLLQWMLLQWIGLYREGGGCQELWRVWGFTLVARQQVSPPILWMLATDTKFLGQRKRTSVSTAQ